VLVRHRHRRQRRHGRHPDERTHDHGATWSNGDGKRFVLWEPYGAHGEDLAELIEIAHRDRLHVEICPSVWCPPYTVGIRFTVAKTRN